VTDGATGLTVNGEAREVPAGTTLGSLVEAEGRGERGCAVAVDGEVVPRASWNALILRDGAAIEIVVAVQGG
jgi:sulfur carrier protein